MYSELRTNMTSIHKGIRLLKKDGVATVGVQTLRHYGLWTPFWNTISSRYPEGTNIFNQEWDLLIILDACRFDTFCQVSDHFSWIESIENVRSVGSMSAEWTLKTFTKNYKKEINKTALLTGNIWTDQILNQNRDNKKYKKSIESGIPKWDTVSTDDFSYYEYTRSHIEENEKFHPSSRGGPHILTDRAISISRNKQFDRLIVHYMLPHKPLVADALEWVPKKTSTEILMRGPELTRELHPWEKSYELVREGKVEKEKLIKSYEKNLMLALEYVEILLENVDAGNVVITSDHGESFGENGNWAHPYGFPFGNVKQVPWATATAKDTHSYQPEYKPPQQALDEQVRKDILKDLGYL